ncbi:MAG: transporter [Chlorobia bacterium]|nr:transporter [Fimbriimonadaceae bacterium]
MNFLSFLSFSAALQANPNSGPIVTDRPDFTESSLVVPLRSIQLESGLTYERTNRQNRALNGPEVLLRFGLAERLELRVGLPNYNRIESTSSSDSEGLDDTYVGAKIQLGPICNDIGLALIPAVSIPTGRKGIRSEAWSPELKVVFSKGLGIYSLSGMIYAAWIEEDGEKRTPLQTTLSLGIPIKEGLGMFTEYILDVKKDSEPAHTFHTGFTFQPKPNRQFDIHFGFGLSPNAPDFFIGAGYSHRF